MSYLVLARKWRPMTFDDLVGQEHVSRTISNAIVSGRIAHAFLFTGVRGVGKTTSARILAKSLNCINGPTPKPCLECPACKEIAASNDMDVQEIDGASYNGVDEVRRLQESLPYRPSRDRFKVVIVDEVHMLSQSAWNAFLKTLEEPPPHVKFVFATTEVHKVPVTILSRCQRYDFKLITAAAISKQLRFVLDQEKITADEPAISLMAREAAGSMRDAMSLLDQAIAWGGTELVGDEIARVLGIAGRGVLHELVTAIVQGNAAACLRMVAQLADQGFDLTQIARDTLEHLRDLVVVKVCKDPSELVEMTQDELSRVRELVANVSMEDLLRAHFGFSQGFDQIVHAPQQRSALEMLLVRLALRPPLLPVDDLLSRIGELDRKLAGRGAVAGKSSGGPRAVHWDRPTSSGSAAVATIPRAEPSLERTPNLSAVALHESPSEDARVLPSRTDPAPAPSVTDPAPAPSVTDPAPARSLTDPAPAPSFTDPTSASSRTDPAPARSMTDPAPPPSVTLPSPASDDHAPAASPLVIAVPRGAPTPVAPPVTVRSPSERALDAPVAPAAQSDRTMSSVSIEDWRTILGRVRATNVGLASVLEHAVPLEVSADKLWLGIEEGSFYEQQARDEQAVDLLTRIVRDYFGASTAVSFTLRDATETRGQTLFDRDEAVRVEQAAKARQALEQHRLVRTAIDALGAKIHHVKLGKN